jgi:hypothetical protein
MLCVLAACLGSCRRSTETTGSYFDSLVVAEGAWLLATKASVSKIAIVNGARDQSKVTPDSLGWQNELDLFRQLSSFERSAYKPYYRIEDGLKDVKSNLSIRRYTATQPNPVSLLQFYYYNRFSNIKKIEAIYRQENLLYATRRRLVMEFDEVNGKAVLTGYGMDGVQKMMLGDSVRFSVHAQVE